eukprot:TRINITY_DN12075_c0_g1_i1.p1 TRINITY_DN12075_c0_g1~~TRINITY_DN12075_c0_g1_i1.p1  ORF type:complete len:691 (-),score=109.26 TRINITY_DN12075_c0_g1_i1:746-2818(-)
MMEQSSTEEGGNGPSDVLVQQIVQQVSNANPALERTPWALCFCVVNFDIEYGQKIERIYPPQDFDEELQSDIAFSAFPDSTQVVGDVVYCFKLSGRSNASTATSLTASGSIPSPTSSAPIPTSKSSVLSSSPKLGTSPGSTLTSSILPGGKELPPQPTTKKPLYGYTFFRQKKDQTLARGYLQKSVLILSRFGFIQLFKEIIRIVGEAYFQYGETLLEAVWHNMTSWAPPKHKTIVELPILGSVIRFKLPSSKTQELVLDPVEFKSSMPVGGLRPAPDPFVSFRGIYGKLWTLWELLIIGEPILVAASSPQTCSDAVLALISLISPLEFSGECRPFFTMHDSDFKYYSEAGHPDYDFVEISAESGTEQQFSKIGSVVIGVTNPYFFKAFEHWPHILTISDENGFGDTAPRKKPAVKPKRANITGKASFRSFSEYETCLETEYRAYYERSKDLVENLKKLAATKNAAPGSQPKDEQGLLKQHFRKLTEAFLVPLEKYFKSLLPGNDQMTLLGGIPTVRPFREASFLSQLLDADMRTKEINVYRRFIRTPSFVNWYRIKKQQSLTLMKKQYSEFLQNFDPKPLMSNRNEVEVVDIYLRVRNYVDKNSPSMPPELAKRYREILDEMLCFLPLELQTSLHVRRKAATGGSPVIIGHLDEAMDQKQRAENVASSSSSITITSTEFVDAASHPLGH